MYRPTCCIRVCKCLLACACVCVGGGTCMGGVQVCMCVCACAYMRTCIFESILYNMHTCCGHVCMFVNV